MIDKHFRRIHSKGICFFDHLYHHDTIMITNRTYSLEKNGNKLPTAKRSFRLKLRNKKTLLKFIGFIRNNRNRISNLLSLHFKI